MSSHRRGLLTAGGLLLGLALSSTAEARAPRVAVIVQLAVNTKGEETDTLASAIAESLRRMLLVDVIAGDEAKRRMPPGGIKADCANALPCLKELAARFEADQLLLLAVVRIGSRVQVDTTWAEPSSGRSVARETIALEDGSPTRTQDIERAARKLLPEAEERPLAIPAAPKPSAIVTPPPPPATEARWARTPVLISAGAGVAALIGGVIAGAMAKSQYDALNTEGCAKALECPTEVDTLTTRSAIADTLFGVALAGGIAAAIFYFLPGASDE